MRRRGLLAAGLAGALAAGCSVLPAAPYPQRRDWPILAARPNPLPPRPRGPVLLVRSVTPAPGLDRRGLQVLQPDGSMQVDFYEQWAVAPADGVEAALREWLAGSGLYAAVVAPGSRLSPGLALEAELQQFWADPGAGVARVALAVVLLDLRPGATKVRLQRTIAATAPLGGTAPPDVARAILAALAEALGQTERALAAVR
ncbi:MAG: membrane integrity-associated transporter subunit PqiC [Proteobacteria bacterium]|nr:membrane integrity-associated transporter subunit PqiC [Pseudomonadota bacterium]